MLISSGVFDLVPAWREEAERLRVLWGDQVRAHVIQSLASQLEEALSAASTELLNLKQAAAVCGYSAEHLGRLVRDGKIPSYGRPNAPRVRRADLPRKAGDLPATDERHDLPGAVTRQTARSIVNSIR